MAAIIDVQPPTSSYHYFVNSPIISYNRMENNLSLYNIKDIYFENINIKELKKGKVLDVFNFLKSKKIYLHPINYSQLNKFLNNLKPNKIDFEFIEEDQCIYIIIEKHNIQFNISLYVEDLYNPDFLIYVTFKSGKSLKTFANSLNEIEYLILDKIENFSELEKQHIE